jgi:hypothetical protein
MTSQMMQHAQLLAAFALRAPGREISYDLAGHLGYLADRLSLERHNFPIVRDRRVAVMGMAVDCGVMRTVFDGFNPVVCDQPMFSEVGPLSCRLSDHIQQDDLDLHSISDTKIIDEICGKYLGKGMEVVSSAMTDRETFPEITDEGFGQDISIEDILRGIGVDQAEEVAKEIEAHDRLDLVFSIMEKS